MLVLFGCCAHSTKSCAIRDWKLQHNVIIQNEIRGESHGTYTRGIMTPKPSYIIYRISVCERGRKRCSTYLLHFEKLFFILFFLNPHGIMTFLESTANWNYIPEIASWACWHCTTPSIFILGWLCRLDVPVSLCPCSSHTHTQNTLQFSWWQPVGGGRDESCQ